jgi:Pyridoxamine 5'-phosphate oxidase
MTQPSVDQEDATMTMIQETRNLAGRYDLPPVEWATVTTRLDQGVTQIPGTGGPNRHTCWLATVNADGSPHLTGIGATWSDGAFWFQTGERTRKARNLASDPRCTLSLATDEFDLVVEGDAQRVTYPPRVAALAERWSAEGWPCRIDETGRALTAEYSAPSAGPRPGSCIASPRGRQSHLRSSSRAVLPDGVSRDLDRSFDVTSSTQYRAQLDGLAFLGEVHHPAGRGAIARCEGPSPINAEQHDLDCVCAP